MPLNALAAANTIKADDLIIEQGTLSSDITTLSDGLQAELIKLAVLEG